MKRSITRNQFRAALAGAVLLALGFAVWFSGSTESQPVRPSAMRDEPSALASPPELPPLARAASRYANTGDDAQFVGNAACRQCHAQQHESYQLTGHSRALSTVEPTEEPPDTEFYHEASGRWYQVYRREGQLRHRESLRSSDGRELRLNDYAVQWAIGSGRFSRSYLVEQDGFLIESPITWYAANRRWDMSPGFDRANHQGFERLADVGCLVCHAGQVTARDGNAFRPDIQHSTIGCESCHGPGSLHVAARTRSASSSEGEDLTIVNPARLSRELSEAVCAGCHLRGQATVFRRGLGFDDLRPGLPLTDVRLDYNPVESDQQMEVVGHVEQMRLSRCYTQSQTMTCMTCHDPHDQPAESERANVYRRACLACHADDDCTEPLLDRLQVDAQDNCVTCHMPKTDTDIPHFAFTHHRIARPAEIPSQRPSQQETSSAALAPMGDISHLPRPERDRALGLAYLEFAEKRPRQYDLLLRRSQRLLQQGESDGDSAAGLARILWELGDASAVFHAQQALDAAGLSSQARTNALVVRGSARLEAGQAAQAESDFQALTKLRRHAGYWQMLSEAMLAQGNHRGAVAALEKAVEIAPDQVDLRRRLSDLDRRLGRQADAAQQREAIEVLTAGAAARP